MVDMGFEKLVSVVGLFSPRLVMINTSLVLVNMPDFAFFSIKIHTCLRVIFHDARFSSLAVWL